MDGIHDLGGKEGYGPLALADEEAVFATEWEARIFGLYYAVNQPDDWNGDWFRHCRELIAPADYLTRPYYDQWLQTLAAMLIRSGAVTLDEVTSGVSSGSVAKSPRLQSPGDVQKLKCISTRFDREISDEPRYAVGDSVTTTLRATSGHTRLPQYIRGQNGVIRKHHDAHVLPDRNALGEQLAEPLYQVEFASQHLWPETALPGDAIRLDLWESYLDQR